MNVFAFLSAPVHPLVATAVLTPFVFGVLVELVNTFKGGAK